MIVVSNLKRPGLNYDSSKLAILGNKISGSVAQRSKNEFIVKSSVKGQTLNLTIKQLNPETGKYVAPMKNEQEILAGRISNYLNSAGISHNIRVKWYGFR